MREAQTGHAFRGAFVFILCSVICQIQRLTRQTTRPRVVKCQSTLSLCAVNSLTHYKALFNRHRQLATRMTSTSSSGSSQRIDEIVRCWADMYEKETLEYGKCRHSDRDDEESEAFAQIFHSLVHSSPALSMTLAQVNIKHDFEGSLKFNSSIYQLQY